MAERKTRKTRLKKSVDPHAGFIRGYGDRFDLRPVILA
jgi:hypothetical protein